LPLSGADQDFRFVGPVFRELGRMLLLAVEVVRALPQVPRRLRPLAEQLFEIGNASLFTACILSLVIGGVLSLQAGPMLTSRGLGNQLGGLVALSMCRELAPVMMGILLAGRIGSAMAAELGSMMVYQEIDALRTLNIRPVPYLLMPRVLAITLSLPCLVIFSNLVGWIGGAAVASWNADVALPWSAFFANIRETLLPRHLINGLLKSIVFAVAIGVVSCHHGMATIGGPRGVGRSVTKAVVNSIVLILILDYVLTRLLLPWDRH
jgi:phospholipid/cholesterol/gamma-HCH transport system permease protein